MYVINKIKILVKVIKVFCSIYILINVRIYRFDYKVFNVIYIFNVLFILINLNLIDKIFCM